MKRIKNFVKNTFKDVDKANRDEIIKQVTESLVEKVEDLMDSGLTEQEAIDKTVVEFGSIDDYFQQEEVKEKKEKIIKTISHYRNDLLFSIIGALIIIGMLIFSNLYYTPGIIWFVLPMLAVLWWPAAVLYNYLNKRVNKGEKDE
jgi:phenylpyruvate tautomerase PptA (4-oxalocrotonate tautomerase family)